MKFSIIFKKIFFLAISIFLFPLVSASQMPDWIQIRDRDGNKFFMDKNGKIWTSGKPEFQYKPASLKGIDYYLHQSIELIKSHYKIEGLTLLKSIMVMPVTNNRVYKAQCKASNEIESFIKREGSRFKKINDCASILLYRNQDKAILINDKMLYSIKFPINFRILNKKSREKIHYNYHGLLLAINLEGIDVIMNNEYLGCDLLIAIDSERYSSSISSIKKIITNWNIKRGYDTFDRKILEKKPNKIIYSYMDKFFPNYSGFEGIYYKKRYSYCLRTISSRKIFLENKNKIHNIVKSLKI